MELTFLSGPIPLTKTITFSPRDDRFTVAPYPLVQKVSSHVENVGSIYEFAAQLKIHGSMGHCLLKGALDRPVIKETRAGRAMDLPHDWVVFDFDKIDCAPNFDGAIQAINKYLPEECRRTACVVQLSASCFRPDATHLSCHVYFMLDTPMATQAMKDWFLAINFASAYDEITLNDAGMSLHYPIDLSVASSSKLIYIAPPRTINFKPPIEEAVRVLDGPNKYLTVGPYKSVPRDQLSAHIGTLRDAAGLPEWQYKTRKYNGVEVLVAPLDVHIHDIKPSGDGYIRFNMNGGDSLAYYIDLRTPGLIGNHKGEPFMQTEQVAKEFYKSLVKAGHALPSSALTSPVTLIPLAFYATNKDSAIYIGTYDREQDQLKLNISNTAAAASWMASFGVPMRGPLPHYELVTDMTSDIRFEDGYPVINLYRQSELLKAYSTRPRTIECSHANAMQLANVCPTIFKVIFSAVGSHSEAMFYMINWLAALMQRRDRTMSAWVLHGRQGTGKGLFMEHILKPLLGEQAVTQQLYGAVEKQFNGWLEGKLLVVFDEAAMNKYNWDEIRTKLYNWITEATVDIRDLNKSGRNVRNYSNIIICSNNSRPVVIEDGDRRFNVGEFQPERLFMTPSEIAVLVDQTEMHKFAETLGSWQVNEEMLIMPYAGEAKERIMDATHNLLERVARAINNGDVKFFLNARPSTTESQYADGGLLPKREYDELIHNMMDGRLNVLGQTDLFVLFKMICGNDKIFPQGRSAQRQVYQRFGLTSEAVVSDKREGKTSTRGLKVKWEVTDEIRVLYDETYNDGKGEHPSNVVPLRS